MCDQPKLESEVGNTVGVMDEPELNRRISNVLDELDETLNNVGLADVAEGVATSTDRVDRVDTVEDGRSRLSGEENCSNVPMKADVEIVVTEPADDTVTSCNGNDVMFETSHGDDVTDNNEDTPTLLASLKQAVDEAIVKSQETTTASSSNRALDAVTSAGSSQRDEDSLSCLDKTAEQTDHKVIESDGGEKETEESGSAGVNVGLGDVVKSMGDKRMSDCESVEEKVYVEQVDQSNPSVGVENVGDEEPVTKRRSITVVTCSKYSEMGTQMDPDELEMLATGGALWGDKVSKNYVVLNAAALRSANSEKDTNEDDGEVKSEDSSESVILDNSKSEKVDDIDVKAEVDGSTKESIVEKIIEKIDELKDHVDAADERGAIVDTSTTPVAVTETEAPTTPLEEATEDSCVPNEGEPEPVEVSVKRRHVHFRVTSSNSDDVSVRVRSCSDDEYASVTSGDDDSDVGNDSEREVLGSGGDEGEDKREVGTEDDDLKVVCDDEQADDHDKDDGIPDSIMTKETVETISAEIPDVEECDLKAAIDDALANVKDGDADDAKDIPASKETAENEERSLNETINDIIAHDNDSPVVEAQAEPESALESTAENEDHNLKKAIVDVLRRSIDADNGDADAAEVIQEVAVDSSEAELVVEAEEAITDTDKTTTRNDDHDDEADMKAGAASIAEKAEESIEDIVERLVAEDTEATHDFSSVGEVSVVHYPQEVILLQPVSDTPESRIETINDNLQQIKQEPEMNSDTCKDDDDNANHESDDEPMQDYITIEPVIPASSRSPVELRRQLATEESSPRGDDEVEKVTEADPEQGQNHGGFLKQVKDKLLRHFSDKRKSVSDDDDDDDRNVAVSAAVCHSPADNNNSDSDASSMCGQWEARGLHNNNTHDVTADEDNATPISDWTLEDSMAYSGELADAIKRYRRNDKTCLSRVKIARYYVAFDMYLPDEYRMSHATLKWHVQRSDQQQQEQQVQQHLQEIGLQQQEQEMQQEERANDQPQEVDESEADKPEVVIREKEPSAMEFERGDRISQLIDIYKYQIRERIDKDRESDKAGDTDEDVKPGGGGDGDVNGRDADTDSEVLDSVSMRSENSLYKRQCDGDKRSDNGSMTSRGGDIKAEVVVAAVEKKVRRRYDSEMSTQESLMNYSDELLSAKSDAENNDDDVDKTDTEIACPPSPRLMASQSCDNLDVAVKRESRFGSLRRRLSRRLSRGFSSSEGVNVTVTSPSRDDDAGACSDAEPTIPYREKRGWFSSLSRLKAKKIQKSQSMSVLNKDSVTTIGDDEQNSVSKKKKSKSKEKKSKSKSSSKKSKDADDIGEGAAKPGTLKKSKSILSLNRFRTKDKKSPKAAVSESESELDQQNKMADKSKKLTKTKKTKKIKRDRPSVSDTMHTDVIRPKVKRVLAKGYVSASSGDEDTLSRLANKKTAAFILKSKMAAPITGSDNDSMASSVNVVTADTPPKLPESPPNAGEGKSSKVVRQYDTDDEGRKSLKRHSSGSDDAHMEFREITRRLKAELMRDSSKDVGKKAGKKAKGTETDVSDDESVTSSTTPTKGKKHKSQKKYATLGRSTTSVGKTKTKYDTDENHSSDDDGGKHRHRRKHDKKHKKAKEQKDKGKGLKRSTSKQTGAAAGDKAESDPNYSLEKVIRTITMCSADIL